MFEFYSNFQRLFLDRRLVINSKILIKNTIKLATMLLKQANGVSWMTIKFRALCQRTQSKYQMSLLTNYTFCTIQITCSNILSYPTFPRSCGLQFFLVFTYLFIVDVPSENWLWLWFSGCAIQTQDISNLILLFLAINYWPGCRQICLWKKNGNDYDEIQSDLLLRRQKQLDEIGEWTSEKVYGIFFELLK